MRIFIIICLFFVGVTLLQAQTNSFPYTVNLDGELIKIWLTPGQNVTLSKTKGTELVVPKVKPGVFEHELPTPKGNITLYITPKSTDIKTTSLSENFSFEPPSFFSAPVKVASGRAAAINSFMPVSDDAMAPISNPAGMTMRHERPELSIGYRFANTKNRHVSYNDDYEVGSDSYSSDGINYITLTYPVISLPIALSLNYNEEYDFQQRFSAIAKDRKSLNIRETSETVTHGEQIDLFPSSGVLFSTEIRRIIEIITKYTTKSYSVLQQTVDEALDSEISFDQEGIIESYGSSLAFSLHPKLSLGVKFNYYQDSFYRPISSETLVNYTAHVDSRAVIETTHTTTGFHTDANSIATTNGVILFEDRVEPVYPFDPFVYTESKTINENYVVDGKYHEINDYEDLDGFGGQLSLMWVANRFLTLAFAVELPWDGDAKQTKHIYEESTTYNADRTRVLESDSYRESKKRNVTFKFPASYQAGAFVRLRDNFYVSTDLTYTDWSAFAYDVEGEGKINPLDGTPHGQNEIKDTYTIRSGLEYLWRLKHGVIPLRMGVTWEQRPAIGSPDNYYGFTLGSGFGVKGWFLDFAYSFLKADNIQSIIPSESSLSTDTEQHQVHVSLGKHL